ncbi:MAG TPA: hypothetical protein VGN37_30210 [Actinocatenispora sp.]
MAATWAPLWLALVLFGLGCGLAGALVGYVGGRRPDCGHERRRRPSPRPRAPYPYATPAGHTRRQP